LESLAISLRKVENAHDMRSNITQHYQVFINKSRTKLLCGVLECEHGILSWKANSMGWFDDNHWAGEESMHYMFGSSSESNTTGYHDSRTLDGKKFLPGTRKCSKCKHYT
jgi:hypothetical protein